MLLKTKDEGGQTDSCSAELQWLDLVSCTAFVMERIKYGNNIDKKTRQSGRFESKDEAGDKEVDDKENYMYWFAFISSIPLSLGHWNRTSGDCHGQMMRVWIVWRW